MYKSSRNLNNKEKDYFKKRNKFINNYTPEKIADNPFLFSSYSQINEFYTRVKIFELSKNISGNIVECGTYTGNSLMLFAHLCDNLMPYVLDKKIIGFDTFNGFDNSFIDENKDRSIKNNINSNLFKNNNYERLVKSIELYDYRRPLGHINKIELVKGDACETIKKYVDDHDELVISLLYLDFDLYKPTKLH